MIFTRSILVCLFCILAGCASFGPDRCSIGDTVTPDAFQYGVSRGDVGNISKDDYLAALLWRIPQPSELRRHCQDPAKDSSKD